MKTIGRLPNAELLRHLKTLLGRERTSLAGVIAYLAEVDYRGLYRDEGCSSMFTYCVEHLGLSEDQAAKRIRVARLSRQFPRVLDELRSGAVHLTGLQRLSGHLDEDNHVQLLTAARGKTRAQIEAMIATHEPAPDVPAVVRKLPSARHGKGSSAELPLLDAPRSQAKPAPPTGRRERCTVAPLSEERFKVQLTAGWELHDKIRAAQQLMRHQVPDGDLSSIMGKALDLLIERQMKQRFALIKFDPSGLIGRRGAGRWHPGQGWAGPRPS